MSEVKQSNTEIQPGIDIQHAASETAAWRSFSADLHVKLGLQPGEGNTVNSYFIPIDDLNNVLQSYPDLSGIRAYFALRPGDCAQETLHLYIVPVDNSSPLPGQGNDVLEVNGMSVIYDTTLPCPKMCGGGNPLNGGITQN